MGAPARGPAAGARQTQRLYLIDHVKPALGIIPEVGYVEWVGIAGGDDLDALTEEICDLVTIDLIDDTLVQANQSLIQGRPSSRRV